MIAMKNVNVLMVCDYRGPNPGNFIPSIRQLERYIKTVVKTKLFMLSRLSAVVLIGANKL